VSGRPGRCVIVGCGYVGIRLAEAWRAAGGKAEAIVRTGASAARLAEIGIPALAVDFDEPEPLFPDMADAWLYYFVPPPSRGQADERIRRFLGAMDAVSAPRGFVLLSTTGVYGDCGGAWIDESAPARPWAERARRRLDAESAVREWSARTSTALMILRVPGIYGPGRLPIDRVRAGTPVLRESDSPWSNRVHVDDLVAAAMAIPGHGRPGAVYNISDGHPGTMTDYFNRVADVAGLPRPPQVDRETALRVLKPGMLSYLTESKRIDNTRMREELGVELRYPDLEAGLAASLGGTRTGPVLRIRAKPGEIGNC
jgi:nucleoside-diphosphate-sugar epimerase